MSTVLVTGGNGYLGTQVIAALLRQGREVRATVRSLSSGPEIGEALRRSGADGNGLEVVAADLASDDGWAKATSGIEEVHHVASPIPPGTGSRKCRTIRTSTRFRESCATSSG
jgi:uncharacterized protein YbjT (DUF2867 family)